MKDLEPHAVVPTPADFEKLIAHLHDLRDSLVMASTMLRDHLAEIESDQALDAQALSQQVIAQARGHGRDQTGNAPLR